MNAVTTGASSHAVAIASIEDDGGRHVKASDGAAMALRREYRGFHALLFVLLLAMNAAASATTDYVAMAQAMMAQAFEPGLPAEPLADWLARVLPPGVSAQWLPSITDCGEGSGSPADRERNMPLCAEVVLRVGDGVCGYLYLFVATARDGLLPPGNGGLYYGYLEWGGRHHTLRRLADLQALVTP